LIVFEQSQIEKSDLILHTYPTSPMITSDTIDDVIQHFIEYGTEYDSFFTAIHFQEYIWNEHGPLNFTLEELPNAVNLPKNIVVETHGLYGIRDEALTRCKRRLGKRSLPIPIPRDQALDINYEEDFKLLEILWKNKD
jgi:N-acylneuraminate cytidylyltransferase